MLLLKCDWSTTLSTSINDKRFSRPFFVRLFHSLYHVYSANHSVYTISPSIRDCSHQGTGIRSTPTFFRDTTEQGSLVSCRGSIWVFGVDEGFAGSGTKSEGNAIFSMERQTVFVCAGLPRLKGRMRQEWQGTGRSRDHIRDVSFLRKRIICIGGREREFSKTKESKLTF